MVPMRGRMINAKSSRVLADFTFRSLRSQRAFRKKPQLRNAVVVRKSGMSWAVSL